MLYIVLLRIESLNPSDHNVVLYCVIIDQFVIIFISVSGEVF